jgi:hypothetical protein
VTVFNCETCGSRVLPGMGYVHSNRVGYWRVDHTECFDMTTECCFAIVEHWSDLLSAHRNFANSRKVAA